MAQTSVFSLYYNVYKYTCYKGLVDETANIILVYDNHIIGHAKYIKISIKYPDPIIDLNGNYIGRFGLPIYSGNCSDVKINPVDTFARNIAIPNAQIKPFDIICYEDSITYNSERYLIICKNVWIDSNTNTMRQRHSDFDYLEDMSWQAEKIISKPEMEY